MALGLVCTVLFSGDAQDHVLREAVIRLEPYFGGQPISADAGSALADAARRAADRPLGSVVLKQHERAVALVAEVRAEERVACSRVLFAGFEARLVGPARPPSDGDVTTDYVGSVSNAVRVLSRMFRGERRLVKAPEQ
jgi:hypothetical protein